MNQPTHLNQAGEALPKMNVLWKLGPLITKVYKNFWKMFAWKTVFLLRKTYYQQINLDPHKNAPYLCCETTVRRVLQKHTVTVALFLDLKKAIDYTWVEMHIGFYLHMSRVECKFLFLLLSLIDALMSAHTSIISNNKRNKHCT